MKRERENDEMSSVAFVFLMSGRSVRAVVPDTLVLIEDMLVLAEISNSSCHENRDKPLENLNLSSPRPQLSAKCFCRRAKRLANRLPSVRLSECDCSR